MMVTMVDKLKHNISYLHCKGNKHFQPIKYLLNYNPAERIAIFLSPML